MGAIDPHGVASFGPKAYGWQDLCKQPLNIEGPFLPITRVRY